MKKRFIPTKERIVKHILFLKNTKMYSATKRIKMNKSMITHRLPLAERLERIRNLKYYIIGKNVNHRCITVKDVEVILGG